MVPSLRGAPLAVALEDLAVFTAGARAARRGGGEGADRQRAKPLGGITALEALDRVSDAVRGRARATARSSRDEFHQALRERLPDELLLVVPRLREPPRAPVAVARDRHPRRAGDRRPRRPQPRLRPPPPAPPVDDPGGALARRFLRAYGPVDARCSSRAWAGLTRTHARGAVGARGRAGRGRGRRPPMWVLAEDAALADPPRRAGARLLPNLDPLATRARPRAAGARRALRKRSGPSLGGPGHRARRRRGRRALAARRRRGKRLVVTVEPLAPARTGEREDGWPREAERLAPFRGAETAELAGA